MRPLIPWFEPVQLPLPGGLTIHGFGVMVAVAFLLGGWMAKRFLDARGLDGSAIDRLIGWLVIGVFVGGHIGHLVFYEPQTLLDDPLSILRLWEGLSSMGGFRACVPITWWFFTKREQKPFWPYAEGVAFGLPFAWIWARIGCFMAHDHPGGQTDFWLGVYGMCEIGGKDVACHDLGLYEAMYAAVLFVFWQLLDRKDRPTGFYVGMLALCYGPVRFGMDFLRTVDVRYFGLTPGQYGATLISLVGLAVLLKRRGAPVLARTAPPEAG